MKILSDILYAYMLETLAMNVRRQPKANIINMKKNHLKLHFDKDFFLLKKCACACVLLCVLMLISENDRGTRPGVFLIEN